MKSEARLEALRDEAARGGQDASATRSYYHRPLLKAPVWTWEVPAYFFAGGLAGVAAVVAAMGAWTGAEASLVRDARWIAGAGAVISPLLLISDLGRPSRFLNMLRVFKLQSPMSIGAWTLMVFGAAVSLSLVLDVTGVAAGSALQVLLAISDAVAALTGLVLATYTGVLIGVSAIPVWAAHARILPFHFGASSLGAGVSVVELCGHAEPALNWLGIAAAIAETTIAIRVGAGGHARTWSFGSGTRGKVAGLAGVLSGLLPLLLRLMSSAWMPARTLAGISAIAGSLVTRFAWIAAGRQSAVRSS